MEEARQTQRVRHVAGREQSKGAGRAIAPKRTVTQHAEAFPGGSNGAAQRRGAGPGLACAPASARARAMPAAIAEAAARHCPAKFEFLVDHTPDPPDTHRSPSAAARRARHEPRPAAAKPARRARPCPSRQSSPACSRGTRASRIEERAQRVRLVAGRALLGAHGLERRAVRLVHHAQHRRQVQQPALGLSRAGREGSQRRVGLVSTWVAHRSSGGAQGAALRRAVGARHPSQPDRHPFASKAA